MAAILADDNFKCIFLNENDRIPLRIWLKCVLRSLIDNKLALDQVMAPKRRQAITWTNDDQVHWCIGTRGRWVNSLCGHTSKKHQSPHYWSFVRGIHRWPVNPPHKGQVAWKKLPFDDVIMIQLSDVFSTKFLCQSFRTTRFGVSRWRHPRWQKYRGTLRVKYIHSVERLIQLRICSRFPQLVVAELSTIECTIMTFDMETLYALLSLFRGIHRTVVDSPHKGPVMYIFNVFFFC